MQATANPVGEPGQWGETKPAWVSGKQGSLVLGCPTDQMRQLAKMGLITVRRIPGCAPRYLLADVERLARDCTTQANAAQAAGGEPAGLQMAAIA